MDYKKEFIKFMYDAGVLTFGDFTAKSGRKTPYFVNTGNYRKGKEIKKLGEFYAQCMIENNIKPDVLYGPAYKGIPLCVAASIAMSGKYDIDVDYCFNRKEEKDHGEGGVIVGHKLKDNDKVVIIEDVITAGTSIRESMPILKNAAKVDILNVVISVDRMEKGKNEKSAVQEVYDDFGLKVYPIVTVMNIIDCMKDETIPGKEYINKMIEYRNQYGVN